MIQNEKKYLSDGINADDAPFVVGKGELINAVNHRFGSSDDGAIGFNESVPGNQAIDSSYFQLNSGSPLGQAKDEVNNRVIVFYYEQANNLKGQIFCIELSTMTVRLVCYDGQVKGGLGFTPSSYINDAFVINGKVYWVENGNDPRSLNIDAGIKSNDSTYVTSVAPYETIDQNTIRLIKKTQNLPLMVRKVQASTIPAIASFDGNHLTDAYQFFVRYIYRDNERSVIGPYSKLIEYNYKDSPLNAVEITFNSAEPIHPDVQIIELGVRYNNIGKGYIIKQWDKANPTDAAAILSHNTSAPLRYYFLNTESGIAVDPIDLAKPFDSIPLRAKTAALARNRYFLGNNLFGYNTPKSTSLAITTTTVGGSGGMLATWYTYNTKYNLPGGRSVTMPTIVADLGPSAAKRYLFFEETQLDYSIDITNDVGLVNTSFVYPTSISSSKITLQTANISDIDLLISRLRRALTGTTTNLTHTALVSSGKTVLVINNLTAGQSRTFKSGSAVKVGVVFFDEDRRKSGVVTNDTLRKSFPGRQFSQIAFNNMLGWSLSNTNNLIEIPDWARYYAVVHTKDLTTDFFFQGHAVDIGYAAKDSAGVYTFNHSAGPGPGGFPPAVVGVGLKITDMISYGLGYTYAQGDLVNLYFPARVPVLNVPVIGQYGDWIIIERINIGALDETVQVIFDVFTPHKESVNEGYYEVGEIYEVLDPGTPTRAYSKTSGIINGNVYAISRAKNSTDTIAGFFYTAEAMSPNDNYWKNWWTDAGWINIVDTIGQQRRPNSVAWSNILIPGTKSNGLSSFDALDVKDLPVENGELNKLILASKVQDEGSVMLAIGRNETASMYLGETQVIDSVGSLSLTASSAGVIGTINNLKGSFGTVNPESVKEHQGIVTWFDVLKGKLIQYSSNGLTPISDYKFTKFFRKYARKYVQNNSTYKIIGGIDPTSDEYLLSMISEEDTGFSGLLPTTGLPNEFDLYDGKTKTLGFKMGMQRFISSYPFYYQMIINSGTQMYTFMRSRLFKHSDSLVPDNNFDEQQYTTKLMFLANTDPNRVKVYSNIAIEANMPPVRAIFYSLDPNEQITDLVESDFILKEGVYYANLYRDRLSPNVTGSADQKLYTGDKIRSTALKVQLEFATATKKLQLKFVNIGYHISKGHST